MARWLVDCIVNTELALDSGRPVSYSDPISGLDAVVAPAPDSTHQRTSGDSSEHLSFKVVVDSPDTDSAREEAAARLVGALDLITGFTGLGASLTRVASVLDWTPNVTPRHGRFFGPPANPGPVLDAEVVLPKIQDLLHGVEIPRQARLALRWVRKGVIEPYPHEQFIFFWIALEVIADLLKPTSEVADRCPFCHEPLGNCPHCERELKHKPYGGQAIRHLVCERLGRPIDFAEKIEDLRHAYVHGDDLDQLAASRGWDVDQTADEVGLLVLEAFMLTVRATKAGNYELWRPETLRHYRLHTTAHFSYNPDQGDLANPDPMKVPKMELTLQVSRPSAPGSKEQT